MREKVVVHSEEEFRDWFKLNYRELGYEKILRSSRTSTPDFVMLRDGNRVKVELETHSKNARIHDLDEIDEVVCVVESCADVPWPVIRVVELNYWPPKKEYGSIKKERHISIYKVSTIRFSQEIWDKISERSRELGMSRAELVRYVVKNQILGDHVVVPKFLVDPVCEKLNLEPEEAVRKAISTFRVLMTAPLHKIIDVESLKRLKS